MHIEVGGDDTFEGVYRWLGRTGRILAVWALRETLPPELRLQVFHCNLVPTGLPTDPVRWAAFCERDLAASLAGEVARLGLSFHDLHRTEPVVVDEAKAQALWAEATRHVPQALEQGPLVWPRGGVLVALGAARLVSDPVVVPVRRSAPQDV